jgi:hypothetical protein
MRHAVISLAVLVLLALAVPATAQPVSDFGTVSVSIRPRIADVFIDGDRWVSPESSGPLVVQLAPGRHSVDVRAPGYRPFSTVVEIRRGESTPLNVSLSAGDPPPQFREQPPPPPPGQPGSIRQVSVQPSGDGFVFAPDFKIAEMNHRTTGFAGFYGGRVFAGQVMIGGGAYFQLDDYPSEQMVYGGLVAEYRLVRNRPVGVTLHGLAGYGATSLPIYGPYGGYNNGNYDNCGYGSFYSYYSGCPYDGFFIAEPEVQVAARFGHSARLVGGIGYRFTSADVYKLNGIIGSISFQFGR